MKDRRSRLVFIPAIAALLCAADASGLPPPQWKPSKSDANIQAIGKRDVGKGLDFYSLEHEKQLGDMLAKQVGKRAKFVGDDTIAVYVDRIGQMVARNSDVRMPVTFRVIDDDSVRAFTLPGGYQYINRGLLLRIKSEAELAGVLAHGIAHTALRSATKEAAQGDIVQMAMIPMMTSADWPGTAPRPAEANVEAAKALYSYFNLGAKRTQELAADYFGLQYVYVTGYDPEGYLDILERVSTQTRSSAASTDVFSASPPLDQRTEAMRKEIAKILPKRSDAVVSTPEFKEFQEQVRAWKANPK